jgi:UTP--glucose-1-phosphate uridylyltransferase
MKAVIAAGGYGTRFLPASKAVPKEMLPLGNKPLIHHQLLMLLSAGISEVIIVVRRSSSMIHDYLQSDPGVERHVGLEKAGALFGELERIRRTMQIAYVHELETWPYGDAEALLAAEPWLPLGEAFYCLWIDDLVLGEEPIASQLIRAHQDFETSVVAVQESKERMAHYWGSINKNANGLVTEIVRKERQSLGLAQLGHFVFTSEIFEAIRMAPYMGELWIGDALKLLSERRRLHCLEIEGSWLAVGDPGRYIEALQTMEVLKNG